MQESGQAVKIIMTFFYALMIILATAKIIGNERKARWFKQRTKRTLFTQRGFLGEFCNFGVPKSWEGALVTAVLFSTIGTMGYIMIFL